MGTRTLDSYAEEADEARELLLKLWTYATTDYNIVEDNPELFEEIQEFLLNEFDPDHVIGMPQRQRIEE